MKSSEQLRAAIIGLVAFAGMEEEALIAGLRRASSEEGNPGRWAARALVAHSTEFKTQQVQRLEAVRRGARPPEFPQIDHSSEEIYRRCAEQSAEAVAAASRLCTLALIEEVGRAREADLLETSIHPWLAGRQLWLQIVVRGFWHPGGHLGEYYLAHGQTDQAIALQARAVTIATLLSAPPEARGMACYNLACAQARGACPPPPSRPFERRSASTMTLPPT
ncbi:MAG: hypothetical protein ABSD97_14020 [Acidimicrobiales bacterium]|jgi:hypothetical protein